MKSKSSLKNTLIPLKKWEVKKNKMVHEFN